MNKHLLKTKMTEAEQMLTVAEEDLSRAMSALQSGPRADKTIVSQAIGDAFVKLRAAKADVAALVKLLVEEEKDEI